MLIKMHHRHGRRVPDPMRPGRTAEVGYYVPSGGTSLAHEGVEYTANAAGWFEVPHEVGTTLLKFRSPDGACYLTPGQVDEEQRLGAYEQPPAPAPKRRPARAKTEE